MMAKDEWIQTAMQEYEQVASLCNAQSLLGNAVMSSGYIDANGHHDEKEDDADLDPKRLTMELQRRNLHDQLSTYHQEIDTVRKTHSLLKRQLSSIQDDEETNQHKDTKDTDGDRHDDLICKRRPSAKVQAFKHHIELSERVIRTIMQSTNGECGIVYENGLVRTSSSSSANTSQHEVNVVALAALRASVSQLKEQFGDGK